VNFCRTVSICIKKFNHCYLLSIYVHNICHLALPLCWTHDQLEH
jgi:hypothetical protein